MRESQVLYVIETLYRLERFCRGNDQVESLLKDSEVRGGP